MSSITSASRMMYAFSRDGATPGPPALAEAEPPARARLLGARDRGARVPLRIPGLLRHQRLRRLRGGHLDRDDRALHRLRDPDLPAAARRATRGSPASGTSGAGTRPIGWIACIWVAFISVLFILPTLPEGIPWNTGFTWLDVNYAIIAVLGTLLLVGGWWMLSAKRWFKGPIAQGSEEELDADRGGLRRGRQRPSACPRRRLGRESRTSEGAGGRPAPSIQRRGRADARGARRRGRGRDDRHGRLRLHRHAGPADGQARGGPLLPRGHGRARARGLQLPARARHGDGPAAGLRDGELGARLRRLPPAARPLDAAARALARGNGARPLRRRLGGRLAGRRLAAPGARAHRSSAPARPGFEPMFGSELEFYLLQGDLRRGPRQALPRPDARRCPTSSTTTCSRRATTRRFIRQLRNGMQAAGIPVESSKGEAWPGQHEINFRYADAMRMADNHVVYKNGAKEIAHANGCSITFMAKPDHGWIGNSCHVHASLWRDGRERLRRPRASSSTASSRAGSPARSELALFLAPERQLLQALRRRAAGRRRRSPGGATTAPAASGSSATAPRSGSRRGSPAETSTPTSPSPR